MDSSNMCYGKYSRFLIIVYNKQELLTFSSALIHKIIISRVKFSSRLIILDLSYGSIATYFLLLCL